MKDWNISRVITEVDNTYGAPMGRSDKGTRPLSVVRGNNGRVCKKDQPKIYWKHVPLDEGYDKGGAYWGIGAPLYVEFTADLSYVKFYRS